jgi:imidazolonepropionase
MNNNLTINCLIYGAEQIVQVVANKESYIRGGSDQMKNLALLNKKSDTLLSLVIINGLIKFIGYESDELFINEFKQIDYDTKINATGCCILPGLLDSHTHPIWSGDRINEFKMKLEGATYMQIHNAGGGIHYTVEQTKLASEQELYSSLCERLDEFKKSGTTFVESKTGYGLDWSTEFKLLRVLTRARREYNNLISISITYLGPHAVPKGKSAEEATLDIINNQLVQLNEEIIKGTIEVDNIDVFCEQGVFSVEQTEKIFEKSRQLLLNLNINFHSNELTALNSVEMGVRLKAKGVSHLEEISDHEIDLLSKSETVGILLPTTAMIMQLKRPPARKMLNSGCIIAIGSDFNPNAYCLTMPLVMNLACIDLRLSMNESLAAATINSAFALGVEKTKGSIEVDKSADLLIIKSNRWENLIYQMGSHSSLIKYVIVNGQIVYKQ